jgi:hypothetical protein
MAYLRNFLRIFISAEATFRLPDIWPDMVWNMVCFREVSCEKQKGLCWQMYNIYGKNAYLNNAE